MQQTLSNIIRAHNNQPTSVIDVTEVDATTAANLGALAGGGGAFSNTTSFTKSGGVFGGGVEVHLGGQWTAKAEYLFMDLGNINDSLAISLPGGPSASLTTNSKIQDNIVRAGLNFKIN